MADEFVKPDLSRPLRFRPHGLDQIMVVQEELDILDQPTEKLVYQATLAQARNWITELTGAVRECENLEARKRAERRAALEKEIAERHAELEELSRIDKVPVVTPARPPAAPSLEDAPPLPADPSIPMPPADPSIAPPPARGKKAPEPYRNTNGMGQPDSRPC